MNVVGSHSKRSLLTFLPVGCTNSKGRLIEGGKFKDS